MQTKNSLDLEIEKNKDNIFISDSIKNIVDLENNSSIKKSSLSISLDNSDKFTVLSYVKKKSKTTITLQCDNKCLNSIILESLKDICVFNDNDVVKRFSIDNFLINYKINCLENNNYLIKIKIWSKDNGIWIW